MCENLDENWLHIYPLPACPVQSFPCTKSFNACVSAGGTVSRQNFVDAWGNLLSPSSCCLNGSDSRERREEGGKKKSAVDSSQNQQHPEGQTLALVEAITLQPCGRMTQAGRCTVGTTLAGPCFFSASHRQTSFLGTTSLLQQNSNPAQLSWFYHFQWAVL